MSISVFICVICTGYKSNETEREPEVHGRVLSHLFFFLSLAHEQAGAVVGRTPFARGVGVGHSSAQGRGCDIFVTSVPHLDVSEGNGLQLAGKQDFAGSISPRRVQLIAPGASM